MRVPLTVRARGVKIVLRHAVLDRVSYLEGRIGGPSDTANVLMRILVRCHTIVILHKRSLLAGDKTVVRRIGFHTASDYNAV